ncbi:MAG: Asp-tRNA(Asn)/Glu-tRNA(Gln) amidotransferase subunit GatB [Bacteroidia bacterium]
MEDKYSKYEAVIGLEVHAQLLTKSKAYSNDINEYGGSPNSHVSTITLGHPGTLPKPNKAHFELAIKMGLALHSNIHRDTIFSRKNYFYADLPKGYQITQDKTPLCTGGRIMIKDAEGKDKEIGITRIHCEEDSGKSQHDIDPFNTLVDLNRAGIPLIEIVTEPDFRHPQEAYNYLTEIRKIVRYLEICDGNMEEGSLRCDANVSVRPVGREKFGTKVEVKNMNSISNVKRALEYEIKRQIDDIEIGLEIQPDTRGFDAGNGTTHTQRSKEEANDYRYFPEPDLPPVKLSQDFIEKIKAEMPPMHWELHEKFMANYGLSDYDATIIASEKYFALYFEELIGFTKNYKAAANWMIGPIRGYLNDKAVDIKEFPIQTKVIAKIIELIDEGKLSFASANQKLFQALLEQPDTEPFALAKSLNLIQESGDDFLLGIIDEVIAEFPDKVAAYRAGKKGLLGMFMGQIMKRSKGKADPKKTNQLLAQELDK